MNYLDAEEMVRDALSASDWLTVTRQEHSARFDLLAVDAQGKQCRVEVKHSNWLRKKGRRGRYCADLHKNEFDILVMILSVRGGVFHFFCVPVEAIGCRKHLTITSQNPNLYSGYLAKYRNTWGALGAFFESEVNQ